jgi:Dolichyl-phosphate-mannose-protein mannosyltransferase
MPALPPTTRHYIDHISLSTALHPGPVRRRPRHRNKAAGRSVFVAPAVADTPSDLRRSRRLLRRRSSVDTDGTPRAPLAVVMVACVVAIAATTWSALTHSMLLYGDARAHLDVARHVTDGLRPGLSQLGSVWLPIPQLLMVPLVALRPLWHNGAAGAIVGGACFTYAAVRIFTLVRELTADNLAAWCAFALFVANANMLYVQTTALTEPVLLAFLVGAVYHLVRWMRTFSVRSLTWAAVLTFLATLTRYEGWALLVAGIAVVAAWGMRSDRRRKSPEANLVLYCMIGSYGIVLWLIYNLTIFGNALYFLHSPYSAEAINGSQAHFGLLGTKGNLLESVLTYGWDALEVVGPALAIAAVVAAAVLLVHRYPERSRVAYALALLVAPAAFEVVSLYAGQTTIRVPQRAPHGMWNDRYGLVFLPFCVVAIGVLVGRRRILGALAWAAGVALAAMTLGTPLTLADGRSGTSSATAGHPELAAAYLHRHYHGGEVLADDSTVSAFMFATNLDLKEFVSPGFHPFWDHALLAPVQYVQWAVASPGDAITTDMKLHSDRFSSFRLAYKDGTVKIYERAIALRRVPARAT